MTKRENAPGWVVLGILILYIFFSIIGFLGFLDLIHINMVEFHCEYRGSASYGYYSFWWFNYALTLLFYGWIAIVSIIRKWKVGMIVGSLILVGCNIIGLISFLFELSSSNYYELASYLDIIIPMNRFLTILNIVGILLMVWNTSVSKVVKVSITAYELLVGILGYISLYFHELDFNLYLTVGKPLISIALLVIYFYTSRESQETTFISD